MAAQRHKALVLAICCSSLFIVGLDNTIVNVALPSVGRDLHAGVTGLQWTVDAYTLVLASLLMLSGATADRVGRRRVFLTGLATFTFGSALCSLAPSLGALIAFRMLQAVGGSMLNPVALSIISNTFTGSVERARAIGVWGGVFGLSMALGPVLGGLLTDSVGWRGVFWVNIPVGLAAMALTARYVPESRAQQARRPDPFGQLLLIVFFGSVTYAIIEGQRWLFAVAAVALAVLVPYEWRRRDPVIDPRFFRSAPFAGAAATAVCAIAAMGGFLFLSTLYLQDVRGYSAMRAGLLMAPMAVTMAASALVSGRVVALRGIRWPMMVSGAAMVAGGAMLSRIGIRTDTGYLLVAYVVFGVGAGAVNAPITNSAVSGMPRAQSGVASGIASTSRQVGQSLGVAITGSMASGGWWVLAACGAVVVVLGVVTTGSWARGTVARVAGLTEG